MNSLYNGEFRRILLSTALIALLLSACTENSTGKDTDTDTDSTGDTGSDSDNDSDSSSDRSDSDTSQDSDDTGTDSTQDSDTGSDTTVVCPGGTAENHGYPPDLTWTGETAQPDLTPPLLTETVTDPSFDNTITRITEDGILHHYAKTQPWNSDGTLIMTAEGGHFILNAETFAKLPLSNVPYQEPRWSSTDPDKVFYLEDATLRSYSVSGDSSSLIHDFSGYGCDLIRLGPWEGNYSTDDKMVAFACQKGSDLDVLLYNIETDTIDASRLFKDHWGDTFIDWVSVSQSGKYVVINWSGDHSIQSFDKDLNLITTLADYNEHGDICIDAVGNEVYVQVVCGGDSDRPQAGIMAYRLDTGKKTIILPPDDFSCTGHISCRNNRRPGWAYVSSTAHHELFAIKLDGSFTVEHFAHTYQDTLSPRGVPDRTGCAIIWASDWSGADASYMTTP